MTELEKARQEAEKAVLKLQQYESSMTDLEKQLQLKALSWQSFRIIMGDDNLMTGKICLYRQADHSYTEISIKMGITRDKAIYACKKCDEVKG